MATVTNKRKVLSVAGKVKAIRQLENGKKESWRWSESWSRKFDNRNDL